LLLQNRALRELKHSFQQYGMVICVSQPGATEWFTYENFATRNVMRRMSLHS
jgi:hypothetical protein